MTARTHPDREPPARWRPEIKATLLLAYPLVLTNVAQALIHATDVALLGRLGRDTLAASQLGINIYTAFLIFGAGLVTAAAPMMARERGRFVHSVRDIRRTARQTAWAALALCIPFWLILWQTGAILVAMGQDPVLAAGAQDLVRTLMWGLFPYLLFVVLRSFVSALERPGWALLIALAAVVMNLAVNSLLIFGLGPVPPLGLAGAGIGSSITNAAMFLGLAAVTMRDRRFRRYRLFGRWWRADWPRFRQVWALGLPIAVTLSLEVTVFSAAVFLMGLIGTDELAAHGIAIQIAALSFMVPLGLSQAVTVRVGLAHGRADPEGVGRAGWTSYALGVGFMGAMALLLLFAPRLLISAFVGLDDPSFAAAIPLAVTFLGVAALFQVVDGAQAVAAGMLRGLQDTTVPMVYALVGYWGIGLSVGAWLAFRGGLGGLGIWIGLATGLAVVSVLMTARWMRRERLGLLAG